MKRDPGTALFTLLALLSFAANSLLTRFALGAHAITAASFTAVRLVSGAAVLSLLVRARAGSWRPLRNPHPVGPLALFAYAAPFSFAYLRIGAAVGALVLFGFVQLTMIGLGIARGERPPALAWAGLLLASAGLAALGSPAAARTRPDPAGVLLMAVAGIAWGVYSLEGRRSGDALATNARSFLLAAPVALLLALATRHAGVTEPRGVLLALVSGAVTSALGYAIWYRALPGLAVAQAAVAQLSVPVLAGLGAVVILGESITVRLLVCGAAILAGIGLVLLAHARAPKRDARTSSSDSFRRS